MLTHILLGYGLSFIGSLPFGIINMTVAHTAIRKGISPALWVAFGASVVEFFQVFIALKFTWIFVEDAAIEQWLKIIATVVFLAAGSYYLFFVKVKPAAEQLEESGKRRHSFAKGLLVSSLNVMAIPYWIFYGSVLTANGLLEMENIYVAVFSASTIVGTFSLLSLYALLGAKILRKHEVVTKWVNKFIGMLLVGFGVYQLVGWLNG